MTSDLAQGDPTRPLLLALPTGRTRDAVLQLLRDAGIECDLGPRGYRPRLSIPDVCTKLLKPQNIARMLAAGSRDLGLTGADWVAELEADVVEVLDTGLLPVRLVAAAPPALLEGGRLPARRLRIASEFETLTRAWIADRGLDAEVVRSFGTTEVLPPEDADAIVDLASTGSTLEANGLVIVDEVTRSSTRLYASRDAMADASRRARIEELALLLRSVLEARQRVMLEFNVPTDRLDGAIEGLPCMRQPTIAALANDAGYAVRAAVPRAGLPALLVDLKRRGGSDLVVTAFTQIVA